jgi:hypothetical protein
MKLSSTVFAALLVINSGCRHLIAGEDVPAVLREPTSATRTELLEALRAALGGASPTLADDALTHSSTLVIDRSRLTGRTIDATAQRFQLVINGGRCILVRPADAWRMPLPNADCIPE